MPGTDLFPDEPEFSPRPAWQVIEAARRQYLTGELTLHTTPTTRVFLRDGVVYFAERSTDGTLAIRLMMEGVITREQMQRGTVIVNGVEHVGRMFDADPTIDRASVELCAELFTDDVLVDVANRTVRGYDLTLYRRHSSGLDRWYPHSVPVVGRPTESVSGREVTAPEETTPEVTKPEATAPEVTAPEVTAPEVTAPEVTAPEVTAPEVTASEVTASEVTAPEIPAEVQRTDVTTEMPIVQPTADTPRPEPARTEQREPKNKLDSPPITLAVPVTRPVGISNPPAPVKTQPLPITPLITSQVPAVSLSAPAQMAAPSPPSNDVDASSIADEVAEAIKRAFAGLGS